MTVKSTSDYTISGADLYFVATICEDAIGSDTDFQTTARNIGNVYDVEITPDVTYVDHFISSKSKKVKDKTVANMSTLSVNFSTDELSQANLAKFFLGSTSASNILVLQNTTLEGSAQLRMDTDVGQSICYRIPKCAIKPNGSFSTGNGEDWIGMPITLDVLELTSGDTVASATVKTAQLLKPYGEIAVDVSY